MIVQRMYGQPFLINLRYVLYLITIVLSFLLNTEKEYKVHMAQVPKYLFTSLDAGRPLVLLVFGIGRSVKYTEARVILARWCLIQMDG